MKRTILWLAAGLFLTACQQQQQQQLETAKINTPSMVCGTCAKNIEKAAYHVEGVKEVNVDVDQKTVEVRFIPVRTNVGAIEEAISGAGYDANGRKRNPDAYEKLEKCCKIDG